MKGCYTLTTSISGPDQPPTPDRATVA